MEKSNNGYSKAYNCSQSQYKSFNPLQTGGQIAWEGNEESGGKKRVAYPANLLKRNSKVFLLPWRKKQEKLTLKYLNLECDNVINGDLDIFVSCKKDNPLLKLTL